MMTEAAGSVVSLRGGRVLVRVESGGCARGGCGHLRLWRSPDSVQEIEAEIPQTLQLKPGDRVIIAVSDAALFRAACLIYLLPIVLMLIGTALSASVLPGDKGAALGAVLGLCAGGLGLRRYRRRLARDLIPVVQRALTD